MLPNNEHAWLPANEIDPDYIHDKKPDLTTEFHKGNIFEVKIIGASVKKDEPIVSKFRVYNDPWEKTKKWRPGEIKRIKITSVLKYKALGIIEKGIDGIIKFRKIDSMMPPLWKKFSLITAGDYLAGVVAEIFDDLRFVELDIASFLTNITEIPSFHISNNYRLDDEFLDIENKISQKQTVDKFDLNTKEDIINVLIIDDDKSLADSMESGLKTYGLDVVSKYDEISASSYLNDSQVDFDIALVDLYLNKSEDYSGLRIVQLINDILPRCKILLISGISDFKKLEKNCGDDLKISGFLLKPFTPEQLRNAMINCSHNQSKPLMSFFKQYKKKTHFNSEPNDDDNVIMSEIQKVMKATGATTVCLFSINPLNYEITLEASAGQSDLFRIYRYKLRYSPVRDVAIVGEQIFENFILPDKISKHKWLYRAFEYQSCIGQPVKAASELAYCLFAFHNQQNKFRDPDHKYEVMIASERIAREIETKRLYDLRKKEMPFIIGGKSYGILGHELSSTLTSQEFQISDINITLNKSKDLLPEEIDQLKAVVEKVTATNIKAMNIINTFRRMAMGQHEEVELFELKEVVRQAARTVNFELKSMNVKLKIEQIKDDFPKIRGRCTAVEQLLYNLLLNAAQQIFMFREIRKEGLIRIQTNKLTIEDNPWIRILIHDTGPGIHAFDFENVFKTGFSTRVGGLGLGLDIAKHIVTDMGGKIKIEASTLFVGTSFEILLPGISDD